jgi:hypothetical protein
MITNIILDTATGVINAVYSLVSSMMNVDIDLTGLSTAVNFLGGLVYTTNAFVPYETFGSIFAILFAFSFNKIWYAMG